MFTNTVLFWYTRKFTQHSGCLLTQQLLDTIIILGKQNKVLQNEEGAMTTNVF